MSVCWRDRVKSWQRSSGSDRAFSLFLERTDDEPKGKLANSDDNCSEYKWRAVGVSLSDEKACQFRCENSRQIPNEVKNADPQADLNSWRAILQDDQLIGCGKADQTAAHDQNERHF